MTARDAEVQRVAARMLRRRASAGTPVHGDALWSAPWFGLHRVAAYTRAKAAQQRAVLDRCARGVLAESRFVERSGMAFCARMTLATENLAQRQVYSLIGADEASHYAWLQPWLQLEPDAVDPFNAFLADCVDNATPQPLAYLMQIVLEGLGIVHYAGLASACNDSALATTLQRMAEDEALHHAAGLAVFSAAELSVNERRFLRDAAYTLLQMIRSGPLSVLSALDQELGGLDRANVLTLLDALDDQPAAAAKLARMQQLMAQPGMAWLVDDLAACNAFVPCTPAESAQIYLQSSRDVDCRIAE